MVLPNFLIIGAAKAGTTSLYYYLRQHPQIFMSSWKEPKFFSLEGEELNFQGPTRTINVNSINNLDDYLKLFESVRDEVAIGEASPVYLYSPKAPLNIKKHIPEAKLIVVLRHPAERAFSSFAHLIRAGYETLSFEQALEEESKRIKEKWAPLWYYKGKGFYAQQLERYFELFDREQIKIYLYEELVKDSVALVQDAYKFLGVDDSFVPDLTRMNVSGVPKSRFLHSLLTRDNQLKTLAKVVIPKSFRYGISTKIKKKNLGSKPVMSVETRNQLTEFYREDILRLQEIINQDLTHWLVTS